jgi:Raf kinase inhibitor-like YbhB/YbcL family protein
MLEKLPESLGHALVNQRAGMESVVYNRLHANHATARLDVASGAFAFNSRLPAKYTADGAGISPPIAWHDVPPDAESIAVIVEDADSPTPHPLVHAIVVGLPAAKGSLEEGALNKPDHDGPDTSSADQGFETGRNSFFKQAWLPPDPPPGHGVHRYVFQVFALRSGKPFSHATGRGEVIKAILERAVAAGCLIGTYERGSRAEVAADGDVGMAVDGNFATDAETA